MNKDKFETLKPQLAGLVRDFLKKNGAVSENEIVQISMAVRCFPEVLLSIKEEQEEIEDEDEEEEDEEEETPKPLTAAAKALLALPIDCADVRRITGDLRSVEHFLTVGELARQGNKLLEYNGIGDAVLYRIEVLLKSEGIPFDENLPIWDEERETALEQDIEKITCAPCLKTKQLLTKKIPTFRDLTELTEKQVEEIFKEMVRLTEDKEDDSFVTKKMSNLRWHLNHWSVAFKKEEPAK